MAICGEYRLRVSFGNPPYQRWLVNHNRLLNLYEHTNGMKTGFTRKAGRCLVTTALKDGVQLICVTLHCPDDWRVHENLYVQLFPTMKMENLAGSIRPIAIPVAGGSQEQVLARFDGPIYAAVPARGEYKVEYRVTAPPFLYAPVEQGQLLGQVELTLDGVHMATLDLTAAQPVELKHPYEPERENIIRRILRVFENIKKD
jgi:D-alanyl-D-alanine carboxypeptidase/D-alanyl-D-alanine carboxypeptidase (penicillin-binding protein 5/6)